MEKRDFVAVMGYVSAGCGKPISTEAVEVYWDLLGDLPLPALQASARRCLLEHRYATFPQVGEIRRLAEEIVAGDRLTAGEAWALSLRAIRDYGYMRQADGLASLPPLVRKAMEAMGWQDTCESQAGIEIIRAQFTKIYDTLAQREQREGLLPLGLREEIAQIGRQQPKRLAEGQRREAVMNCLAKVFREGNVV